MKGKLSSNELIADFDYSTIDEDYSFFRVETSDKYISGGANFLDLDDLSFVRSVVFERGKSFYVMTSGTEISRSGMMKVLGQYEGSDSLSITQLKAEDISDTVLLQLFLNSLSNPEDEMCSYNNLSGKLFCYKPTWLDRDDEGVLWGLNCIEIRISKDMCLRLSAHRLTSLRLKNKMKFEKRKIYEYPQYEFSYNNHTLRRVSGEKLNDKSNLIQKPVDGERGNVSFFDFSNYEAFSCTKMGLLHDIFGLVKSQFGRYFSIELSTYEIDETLAFNRKGLEEYKKAVSEQLIASGINVIDEVQSTTSEAYLQDLCDIIKDIFPVVKCNIGKRLSKGKVNLRYIHDKSFYAGSDPHADDLKDYVVQHITVENFSIKAKAAIENILKEMVIKKDIKDGKLSIVDWTAYKYPSDWVFGTVIDKEYYFMCIHPDGSFEIKQMVRNLLNMTEYDSYMDFFCIDDFASGDYSGVVGVIKDSSGNINLIKETEIYTLPSFEQMGDVLSNVASDVSFTGAELVSLLHDTRLSSDDVKIRAELDVLIPTIDLNAKYDKKTIMGLFKGMKTKKAVVGHVFENTGVMLYAFLRGEEARNDYMSGTLDINYIQMSGEVARFCVGEIGSGMKYTMERASVIREVQAVENSSLIFKDILPLMGVEFVRYGMLTVMPFPFKYLREYKQMR